MADPIGRPDPSYSSRSRNQEKQRLKHAFDAGFVSGTHPSDTPDTVDADDGDSATRQSSDLESSNSDGERQCLDDLAATFRVLSDSMLRIELAELEMVKAREASRLAAEKRRAELEFELTQMLLQTQLQIASCVAGTGPSRKRKRSDEDGDDSSTSEREGAVLLSLLQCSPI